mgnify:CR=1 FL=1
MADMTRAEARGILQQLVKQQQAVARLAEVVAADAALEVSVPALRKEVGDLTQAMTQARQDLEALNASVATAAEATREAQKATLAAQQELANIRRVVEESKREADAAMRAYAEEIDTARKARLAEVERAVTQRRDRGEADHRDHVLSMRTEIDELQARKESLVREMDAMLSRFGAR